MPKKRAPVKPTPRAGVEWQRRAEVAEREVFRLQDEIVALRHEVGTLRAELADRVAAEVEPEADVPPEGGA
jgi:hypothetical protein